MHTGDMRAQPLVTGSQDSIAILNLAPGSQYRLFASAVDNVGNQRPSQELIADSLLVDFPISQALCVNNCSNRGSCTTFGTCDCSQGFYGSDCSRGIICWLRYIAFSYMYPYILTACLCLLENRYCMVGISIIIVDIICIVHIQYSTLNYST